MNVTAADFPEGHNELHAAGLHPAPSLAIGVPRVAEAQVSLECALHKLERIGENNLIIGQILAIHTAEGLVDERLHVHGFHPIGRLGAPSAYARTTDRFDLPRVSYPLVMQPQKP